MPFDIITAPRLFTKIMCPVFATLRSKGAYTTAYLNDDIAWFQTMQEAIQGIKMIVNLFLSLELTVNFEKSSFFQT